MSTTVTTKYIGDMTPGERTQCGNMGYHRDKGMMRREFANALAQTPKSTQVVMATDPSGRVRGMAMINRNYDPVRPEVYYWTQHRWRRKGIGRALAQGVVAAVGPRYDHYYHENPRFFAAVNAQTP